MVTEVANKFAQSHFRRGVRDQNVRLLTKIVIQYIQVMRQQPALCDNFQSIVCSDV